MSDFHRAGFTPNGTDEPPGYLSRDGFNNDWIYWSTATNRMFRKPDGRELDDWKPSPETKKECLRLGRVYAERVGIPLG